MQHQQEQQSPPTPRRQQLQPGWSLIVGAAASLLLLVVLLALGAGQQKQRIDGGRDATGGLRLFRRPLAGGAGAGGGGAGRNQGTEEPPTRGLEPQQQQQQQQREQRKQPSLRRPGKALGGSDVLWGLEPRCLAALYSGGVGAGTEDCGCTPTLIAGPHATAAAAEQSLLAIVDGPHGALRAGSEEARFTLRSAHQCSDVLNAAFHSPGSMNALGHDVTVPARVVALDGGEYAATATLPYAGEYTLKVRMRRRRRRRRRGQRERWIERSTG
jgi:hypothetical protein